MLYSGTSGLVLPFTKSDFPEQFRCKTRLEYYSTLFNSIEINSIFYKLPRAETLQNWSEQVPPDFRFTFKLSKSITHSPQLNFDIQDLERFLTVINNVGQKKGCILAQFPPSFTITNFQALHYLLKTFNESALSEKWKLALEFRNASWNQNEVYELLDSYGASMVWHDLYSLEPQWDVYDQDIMYVRFHGPEPRYRGNYSDAYLTEKATIIKNYLKENKQVYIYFNNTMGAAYHNLITLNHLITGY